MNIELKNNLRQRFTSNDVLFEKKDNQETYYLPAYVRLKIEDVDKISIGDLDSSISASILFSFYYGNLSKEILNVFMGDKPKKKILMKFNRQESLQIEQGKGIQVFENKESRLITYQISQDFNCSLDGAVFYTPFQIIGMYLTVELAPLRFELKQKNIEIKFNCMDSRYAKKIQYSTNCDIGKYGLATHYVYSFPTSDPTQKFVEILPWCGEDPRDTLNKRFYREITQIVDDLPFQSINNLKSDLDDRSGSINISKHQNDHTQPIKNHNLTKFRIPMYKYPVTSLVAIFGPLFILGFIGLTIYFQSPDLGGRLGTIATLILAFVALIPTINQSIPPTNIITMIQIAVYLQTFGILLVLIQSLYIRDKQDLTTYVFNYRNDGFFIASLIINIINLFGLSLYTLFHKCIWESGYLKEPPNNHKKMIVEQINRTQWANYPCDIDFYQAFKAGKITRLPN